MGAQAAPREAGRAKEARYAIGAEDSKRIQIWKLWLCLMMPLNHIYTLTVRVGSGVVATMAVPGWLDWVQYLVVTFMTHCAPPAFALISAVLLFRKPFRWGENLKRKCRTILLPLVLLTSLWVALYAVGPLLPGLGKLFSGDADTRVWNWTPQQWFAAYFGWTPDHMKPTLLYPLWFLRDLMLMNLIAPAIRWAVDRFPRIFLGILAVLLVWHTDLEFVRITVQEVFVFFSLGCYVVKYDLHFSDLDRVPAWLVALMYLLVAAVACLFRDYYTVSGALRGISNAAGVLFYARCCTHLPEGKWKQRLLWLSEYGIAIYFFHERPLSLMKRLALRMLPVGLPTTLAIYYLVPAANAALCVLAACALRRILPKFYALLTGGR